MEALIQAMSGEELEALRNKHIENESVVTLINGILEARALKQLQEEASLKFQAGIAKTFEKLSAPPQGILNVYARWETVDMAVKGADGVMVSKKLSRWSVELNKTTQIGKASPTTSTGGPKARAITVYKPNREDADILIGTFQSAAEACRHLGLQWGGDSPVRHLKAEGYACDVYDGTDFKVAI